MTISERIYRILLRLYPARYLRDYAEPMAQSFRDQERDCDGGAGMARLWIRTLADLAATVPARHWERWAVPRDHISPFDQTARYAFFCARQEASSFGRREITLEHLLLGLLRSDPGLAKVDVNVLVRKIEAAEAAPRRTPPTEDLPLSDECRRAARSALRHATRERANRVAARHLLAGILDQRESLAARLLRG